MKKMKKVKDYFVRLEINFGPDLSTCSPHTTGFQMDDVDGFFSHSNFTIEKIISSPYPLSTYEMNFKNEEEEFDFKLRSTRTHLSAGFPTGFPMWVVFHEINIPFFGYFPPHMVKGGRSLKRGDELYDSLDEFLHRFVKEPKVLMG